MYNFLKFFQVKAVEFCTSCPTLKIKFLPNKTVNKTRGTNFNFLLKKKKSINVN